jgi:hypothetical protein
MFRFLALIAAILVFSFHGVVSGQVVPGDAALSSEARPIDPGSVLLGGSISFGYSELGEGVAGVTSLYITPRALYFVAPGLAVGGTLLLSRSWQGERRSYSYGVGPETAYYFDVGSRSTYPFIHLRSYYRFLDYSNSERHSLIIVIEPGLAFFVARNVSISLRVPFSADWYKFQAPLELDWSRPRYAISAVVGIDAFVF